MDALLGGFNEGTGNSDVQFLLQCDSQYSSDAPWVHAFGEDDDRGRRLRYGWVDRGGLLQRDSQCSSDAPWVHACGEGDEITPA